MIFSQPLMFSAERKRPGHRYWRVRVTATNETTYAGFSEIEFRGEEGGPSLTGNGAASASSHFSSSTPDRAFDGSNTTHWTTQKTNLPAWIMYDFGRNEEVAEVSLRRRSGGQMPTHFTIQYSDDTVTWTTAVTISGAANNTTMVIPVGGIVVPPSQRIFYQGSHTFKVPAHITFINVAGIGMGGIGDGYGAGGGGACGYANGIPVTPGETLNIVIDTYATLLRGSTVLFQVVNGKDAASGSGGAGGATADCTLPSSYTTAALSNGTMGAIWWDDIYCGGRPVWPGSHSYFGLFGDRGGHGYYFGTNSVTQRGGSSQRGADYGGGSLDFETPGGATMCITWGTFRSPFVPSSIPHTQSIYF